MYVNDNSQSFGLTCCKYFCSPVRSVLIFISSYMLKVFRIIVTAYKEGVCLRWIKRMPSEPGYLHGSPPFHALAQCARYSYSLLGTAKKMCSKEAPMEHMRKR